MFALFLRDAGGRMCHGPWAIGHGPLAEGAPGPDPGQGPGTLLRAPGSGPARPAILRIREIQKA